MTERPPFYITTAISYVNGAPHLGHAYEAISTDVIARYKRLDGYDVFFLTGTDEHGQKVEKTARACGKEPKEFCDEISNQFIAMVDALNITNDAFIRTTDSRHILSSRMVWKRLEEAGDIYLSSYTGWYSVRDEAFFSEEELTKDGDRWLAPSGAEVEWIEEPSYFFRLSAYQDKLLAHYEANPDFIMPPHRRNEVVNFVKQGLTDLSVSRTSFNWGVPVPGDDRHIMYVWLDALTNYITAVGYPDENADSFQKYWPADVHVIGKDILRFHAVYWPAFLMSAGIRIPKKVFGHGFLTIEGQKMSKSLGNVVTPDEMKATYGVDQMRYFLMREVPYGSDGSVAPEAIVQRINSDLANDLGNLGQRVLSMIHKNCDGILPTPGALTQDDDALLIAAKDLLEITRQEMADLAIHRMLEAIWRVVADANRYVDAQAPWALRKRDPARMGTVLYVLADVIRQIAIFAQPVIPEAASALLDQLAVVDEEGARSFSSLEDSLSSGARLPMPSPIFPRFVVDDPA
ncbi:MAG: methionine--tRNA ligase [Rhodospirillaceae bacterium]|nr:methionine--tRNA ligase [Rhodospirillaceae bacterium]